MPLNNELEPIVLPMKLKWNEKPTTKFLNNLDALKVELVDSPTRQQMLDVAWHMVKATWADLPEEVNPLEISNVEKSKNLIDVMQFRALPTPMECMGFTFRLSGLSFQEVTHIIRHRAGSFAAQCTGDRTLRDDDSVIPEPIENSPEFLERYKKIVEDSKQLYADMCDSRVISMMDARMILPKCMTSFYYMRLSLKDLIPFIKQRIDQQIQPVSDNVIACLMTIEIAKALPEITQVINFDAKDTHYINTFRVKENGKWTSKGTNLYRPLPKNDVFDYHTDDTIYPCLREELNGTNPGDKTPKFTVIWDKLMTEFAQLKVEFEDWQVNN